MGCVPWPSKKPARISPCKNRSAHPFVAVPVGLSLTSTLGCQRVWLFEVDVEFFEGFLNGGRIYSAFALQFDKGGEGDEARVDFEEVAERGAALAAAESVGAERSHAARHPT